MNFKTRQLRYLVFAAIGIILASYIRVWLAGIFLIPLAISTILSQRQSFSIKASIIALSGFAYVFAVLPFFAKAHVTDISSFFAAIDKMSKQWAHGGAGQQVAGVSNAASFIINLPKGAFTALFRPLPGEINNPFGIMSGLENLALLFFTISYILKYNIRLLKNNFLLYNVLTIFVWTSIYAYISSQNLGTAVRFKLQVLPFMLLLPYFAQHIYDKRKNKT
ncbi:hypothetical protein N9W41_01065 [bacterium]|nr:hypothetical protein [bacterium]